MANDKQPSEEKIDSKDSHESGQQPMSNQANREAWDSMIPAPKGTETTNQTESLTSLTVDTATLYASSPARESQLTGQVSWQETPNLSNDATVISASTDGAGALDSQERFLPAAWGLMEILTVVGGAVALIQLGMWGKQIYDELTHKSKPEMVKDDTGLVTDINYPDGKSRHFDHDNEGRITGFTDKDGHHWNRSRDKDGNLTDEWVDDKGNKMHAKLIVGEDGSFTKINYDKNVVEHFSQFNGDPIPGGDKPFGEYTPEQLKALERIADIFELSGVGQSTDRIHKADAPDDARQVSEMADVLEKHNPPEGKYPRFQVNRDKNGHVTSIYYCENSDSAKQVYPKTKPEH